MASVLVTGCSTGFGRLAALTFARAGHATYATMRTPAKSDLADVAAAEGLSMQVLPLDVLDDASVRSAVDEAGPLDVLVNNAGIELRGPIEEAEDDEVRAQFDTNVFGLLRVVRAVLPGMRERGSGVVVNVGSVAGIVTRPFGGLYSATKFAVEAITEAMHFELKGFGIRVAVVEPGVFPTELVANAAFARRFGPDSPYRATSDAFDTALERLNPTGVAQDSQDVADAIVRAATDPTTPLWVPVGADAELIVAVRSSGAFEEYEQAIRTAIDFWD